MDFKQLAARAVEIRKKYSQFERVVVGKEWGNEQILQGMVGDVGMLVKLVMQKEGWRKLKGENTLEEELSDVLWSLIVLADKYGVDLEKEFLKTMDYLEDRIDKKLPH